MTQQQQQPAASGFDLQAALASMSNNSAGPQAYQPQPVYVPQPTQPTQPPDLQSILAQFGSRPAATPQVQGHGYNPNPYPGEKRQFDNDEQDYGQGKGKRPRGEGEPKEKKKVRLEKCSYHLYTTDLCAAISRSTAPAMQVLPGGQVQKGGRMHIYTRKPMSACAHFVDRVT